MKSLKTGGTDLPMLISIFRHIVLSVFLILSISVKANAADISAVDFNGNMLGKVIPDGSVISFDNELIGHITADGFAIDENNLLIGGIVPQGVAISYDNNILGKVNNDGTVTSVNDKLVGKALPNGLVVNDNYDILGAVIAPGLVYDDNGKIVGRISGDGKFYNLSGENTGYVTASGYVFAPVGTERKIGLIGRLISSKMINSSSGKFVGSITPDGKVINLDKKIIGTVHANGFVYDADNVIVGHIVEDGYAFNFNGDYLGIVSYDGTVISKGNLIAYAVYGNRVINKDGELIGFTINMSATVNTIDGKYLGRLAENGNVVKARDIVGRIGASGKVINEKGEIIGIVNAVGPIFDYLGQLRANAAVGGKVISLDGIELGYMQSKNAYDRKGKELGKLLAGYVNYNNNNEFIGVSGITSSLIVNNETYTITPYGYIFDESQNIAGRGYLFSNIISPEGNILSYVSENGKAENKSLSEISKLTSAGVVLDEKNQPLGNTVITNYATDFSGNPIGYTSFSNSIIDNKNASIAKILPNYNVVSISGNPITIKGQAGNSSVSIGINGDYLGANLFNGSVVNTGNQIGKISEDGYVLDNLGALYGSTIPFGVVVSPTCQFLGVMSSNGDARTTKDSLLGTVLANRQVINETEDVIGQIIYPQIASGVNGKILGVQTPLGTILNYTNQNLGCQDLRGKIRNAQNDIIGQVIPDVVVMNFDNKVIGKTDFTGNIVDNTGKKIGAIGIDENAYAISGQSIGTLFRYKVAFDNNNTYLGRINQHGDVVSDNGDILGRVNYNGLVIQENGEEGFALYDLYVYDNEGKTIGYIAKNGHVYSIMGDLKGSIYRGFVLDKKQNLIARGARDYYIRDEQHEIIGYLNFNGDVVNDRNVLVGKLNEKGEIINDTGSYIASADPLQYYHLPKVEEVLPVEPIQMPKDDIDKAEEQIDEPKSDVPDEKKDDEVDNNVPLSINDTASKYKLIGIAVTPGGKYIGDIYSNNDVIDSDGNVIGTKGQDGQIRNIEGEVIGKAQDKQKDKNKAANSNWWKEIMNGVTASPYNTNDEAVNVGPGGGIGPGGRYNPKRAEILSRLQNSRRQSLSGKSISSNFNAASYTGWQDDWGTGDKNISTLRVDMSNMIGADKPIPAVLARSLVSLGSAPITAIVERNVYGDTGRNIIIPAGSRILGGLDEDEVLESDGRFDGTSGGVKMGIKWQRIIRPDGIAFLLDTAKTQTGDAQGRGGGALGYVDEQLVKKYTVPLLGTVATSAIAYMMAADKDATGEVETSKQQAASDARQEFMEKMSDILDEIIDSKSEIEPVTFIPAGTRIIIYPRVDLWLRTAKLEEKGEKSISNAEKPEVFAAPRDDINDNNAQQPNVQGNNNQQQNQATPLAGNSNQNQQNTNQQTVGAIPPPAADGTVTTTPYDEDELSGDIELF